MSNRIILSPQEILFASDVLKTNKNIYVGLGRTCEAILGTDTQLNGFDCTQTPIPSLDVTVGSGEIYIQEPTDPTAYGVLPVDNTPIIKQGIFSGANLAITPPTTPGNSTNYLIQIGFEELDSGGTSRPFYNSSNPSSPIYTSVNTERLDNAVVQLKAGIAAPTGTQTTPSPDAGFIGAWVVTVANGQSTITSPNITAYSNAPFITEKLKDKISQSSADLRYATISTVQSGAYVYAQDTGSVNSLVASVTPAITSLYEGLEVRIKIANTNTGAATLDLNGFGVKNIISLSGNSLVGGELLLNNIAILTWNGGPDFILQNPSSKFLNTSSGYTYLAGGLILQWGKVNITANNTTRITTPVTFPIPFTTSCFSITTSYNDANPASFDAGSATLTNNVTNSVFDFIIDQGASVNITHDVIGNFIAIGN